MKKLNYFEELQAGIINQETFDAILVQYKYGTKKLKKECETDFEDAFSDFIIEMDNKGIAIEHGDKRSFWEYKLKQTTERIDIIKNEFGIVYKYGYEDLEHKEVISTLLQLKAFIANQLKQSIAYTSKNKALSKVRKKKYYIEFIAGEEYLKIVHSLLIEEKVITSNYEIFKTHFSRNNNYREIEKIDWIKGKHTIDFFLKYGQEIKVIKLSNPNNIDVTIKEHFNDTENISVIKAHKHSIDEKLFISILNHAH